MHDTARERLKQWMAEQNLSQAGLGSKIGLTQPTISKFLSGAAKPSPEVAFRIEDATGIPAREWFIAATVDGAGQ